MSRDCAEFQNCIADLQLRNKSILDITTKLSEQNARVNRAVFKSVTHCGCISIDASKQVFSDDKTLHENKDTLKTHIKGGLCATCQDKVEEEIGDMLFYIASLCEALNLDMQDIVEQKIKELKTLGIFNLL